MAEAIPDLAKMSIVCNNCLKEIHKTNDEYDKLIMLNKSSQELKNLMEIYANYIVFDDILSIQINENIKS